MILNSQTILSYLLPPTKIVTFRIHFSENRKNSLLDSFNKDFISRANRKKKSIQSQDLDRTSSFADFTNEEDRFKSEQ